VELLKSDWHRGCISSVVRLFYLKYLWDKQNYHTNVSNLVITCIVELSTGIMASSLATLRPLIRSVLGLPTISSDAGPEERTDNETADTNPWREHGVGLPKIPSPISTANSEDFFCHQMTTIVSEVAEGEYSVNQTAPLPDEIETSAQERDQSSSMNKSKKTKR
jgi:hypothetical protein